MSKDTWQFVLEAFIIVGLFVAFFSLLKWSPPADNKEALYMVLGVLAGGYTTIIGYRWGSSQGSKDKDEKKGG